jgi:hypothetical protein
MRTFLATGVVCTVLLSGAMVGATSEPVALDRAERSLVQQLASLAPAAHEHLARAGAGRLVRLADGSALFVVRRAPDGVVAVDRGGQLFFAESGHALRRVSPRTMLGRGALIVAKLGRLVGQPVQLAALRRAAKVLAARRARAARRRWEEARAQVQRLFATLGLDSGLITSSQIRVKPASHRFRDGYVLADGLKEPGIIGYPGDHVSTTTWKRLSVSFDGLLLITTMVQPEDHPEGFTDQRIVSIEEARRAFPEHDLREGVRSAFCN